MLWEHSTGTLFQVSATHWALQPGSYCCTTFSLSLTCMHFFCLSPLQREVIHHQLLTTITGSILLAVAYKLLRHRQPYDLFCFNHYWKFHTFTYWQIISPRKTVLWAFLAYDPLTVSLPRQDWCKDF